MTRMSGFGGCRAILWPMILAVLCATACSRPAGVPVAGANQPDQAPFREAKPPEAAESAAPLPEAASQTGLPFHDSQNLPVGTMLTVRLSDAIAANTSVSEVSFEGVIDDPVIVEGNTLIPRGTTVAGRVEAARFSKLKRDRGYVRLGLESVHIGGLDVPVHTASLFARQAHQHDASIQLEKGRRLTFRLIQPFFVGAQRAELQQ